MTRAYARALLPQVLDDLRALAEFDDQLVDVAHRLLPTDATAALSK